MRGIFRLIALGTLAWSCHPAPRAEGAPTPTVSVPPAPTGPDTSAPNCPRDPYVAWLEPRDRECRSDADCIFVVSKQCGFAAINRQGALDPRYEPVQCYLWPNQKTYDPTCQCSVPGIETRCGGGCCQYRIMGGGAWNP